MNHRDAKYGVAFELQAHLSIDSPLPQIEQVCIECGDIFKRPLQQLFDEVVVERKLANGYQPDVTLVRQGRPVFAVEIYATHAVDETKRQNIGIPFIELTAESALKDPLTWVPTNNSDIQQGWPFCEAHKQTILEYRETIRDYVQRHRIPAGPNYVPFLAQCQHCGIGMICHTWLNRGLGPLELPLGLGAPRNQVNRFSHATYEEPYSNLCFMCGNVQDDSELYRQVGVLITGRVGSIYELVVLAAKASLRLRQLPDRPQRKHIGYAIYTVLPS